VRGKENREVQCSGGEWWWCNRKILGFVRKGEKER